MNLNREAAMLEGVVSRNNLLIMKWNNYIFHEIDRNLSQGRLSVFQ